MSKKLKKISQWIRTSGTELPHDPISDDIEHDDDWIRMGRTAPRPRRMSHPHQVDEPTSNFRDLLSCLRSYAKLLDRVDRLGWDASKDSPSRAEEIWAYARQKSTEAEQFEMDVAKELGHAATSVRNGIISISTFLEDQTDLLARKRGSFKKKKKKNWYSRSPSRSRSRSRSPSPLF